MSEASKLTPYIVVRDAKAALDFYKRAFGAEEVMRLEDPTGRIGHAHMTLEGAALMLADEHPEFGALSPMSIGGTPVRLHLEVADVDLGVQRAVDAGATVLRPVEDQFHGNRSGMVADPFGHQWLLSAPTESVTPEEMQRRYERLFKVEDA